MIPSHRIARYLQALYRLYKSGKGLLPWAEIEARLAICRTCDHFTGLKCELCGCCGNSQRTHFNKLAFPTESCPDDPPKWTARTDIDN